MNKDELILKAKEAAKNAYAPYSKFRVGAVIECMDGTLITGGNVENRSFGLTICAERSALVKAISLGKKEFKSITLIALDADYPVSPCGACRQVLSEFVGKDFPITFADKNLNSKTVKMEELFPFDALHELSE